MSTSTALAKRAADTALMPPPPPTKRIKRPPKVLDEDTYTAALSHIIARDFFPGLLESEAQQEYLDALDTGDQNWISDAGRRVREVMTPVNNGAGRRGRRGVSMTPSRAFGREGSATPMNWRGETPMTVRSVTATPSGEGQQHAENLSEKPPDLNMGLGAFQTKYTSEDNESFNKVLDRQNAKRAEKYRWMWDGNKMPSARRIAQAAHQQKLLEASGASFSQSPSNETSTALILSRNLDDRPASIDPIRHSSGPRNNLMFTPDDISDSHPHHTTTAQAAQTASSAPPKAVSHINTRLASTTWTDASDTIPPSPSLSAVDAAIAGQLHLHPGAPASTTESGAETPRVNGYAFVDEDPTPSELGIPMSLEEAERRKEESQALLAQMIAAGEEGGGGPNPFTINEASRREALHHRMVEKTMRGKRTSRLSALKEESAVPRFVSSPRVGKGRLEDTPRSMGSAATAVRAAVAKGIGNLTPAARMLYNKVGRTPVAGGTSRERLGDGGAFDAGGIGRQRGGWTPTPLRVKRL